MAFQQGEQKLQSENIQGMANCAEKARTESAWRKRLENKQSAGIQGFRVLGSLEGHLQEGGLPEAPDLGRGLSQEGV